MALEPVVKLSNSNTPAGPFQRIVLAGTITLLNALIDGEHTIVHAPTHNILRVRTFEMKFKNYVIKHIFNASLLNKNKFSRKLYIFL